MIKILFHTDTPIYGGAERHMLLLATKLNPEKFQVALACSNYKSLNVWCAQWKAAGFTVHRLKVAHKHDPRHIFQLKKVLKIEQPDIVHNHLWNPGSCRYTFSAINKKTTKIVSTEHDPFPLKGLKNSLKKRYLAKTDHTIMVSEPNRLMWIKQYPFIKNKISTIHNGIDTDSFEKLLIHFSAQDRAKTRTNNFKADSQSFVILSVAALHPRKGLDTLIKSFPKILEEFPDARLALCGEGPERKNLEKLIKKLSLHNHVVLLGFHDNIPFLMKSADMFVLPSVKEAFGLVLLEAMASGLPIIASRTGGITDIIDNKNGILVEPGDKEQLATKIIELIANKPLREKLAYVGHHDVKKFDAEIMAKKTGHIYTQVMNSQ